MSLLLASDATREVAFLIDCAECEAGFIAVQTWSWCCSRMAIEARARASVRTGGTGGRVVGPRGSGEAAAGVLGSVGAVLSVRGGAGPRGMVLVPSGVVVGGRGRWRWWQFTHGEWPHPWQGRSLRRRE